MRRNSFRLAYEAGIIENDDRLRADIADLPAQMLIGQWHALYMYIMDM